MHTISKRRKVLTRSPWHEAHHDRSKSDARQNTDASSSRRFSQLWLVCLEGNLAPMTVHCQFIIWSNDRQGLGPSLTPLRHLPLWAMGNPEMMHGQWRRNNTTKCNTPRLKKQTRAANFFIRLYITMFWKLLKRSHFITLRVEHLFGPIWKHCFTLFKYHRKSLIQHFERSKLRLHFERTKVK